MKVNNYPLDVQISVQDCLIALPMLFLISMHTVYLPGEDWYASLVYQYLISQDLTNTWNNVGTLH